MTDMFLDPDTNDLSLAGGRPVTVATNGDLKAQRIRNRLMTVKGEWFMDTEYGLDYRGVIWVKAVPMAVKGAHIRNEILKAADVGDQITEFSMTLDNETRQLSVTATVASPTGTTTTVSI